MPAKIYDAIVVGSGANGGWAAKQLCEGGMEVLVLEAGRKLDPAKDFTEHTWPYQMPFRGFGRPGWIAARQASTIYFASEYTTQLFVDDFEAPYTTPPDKPFNWVRSRHVGGRSVTWGRQSYRFSNYDFQAASHDGYGVNWPFRYEDLAPYYDQVEEFIGVSGRAEGWEALPDGKFLPPMNYTCGEQLLKQVVDGYGDRRLTIGRTAILTRAHQGRPACHWCGHCGRGCTTGSYYSSPASTLPAAARTGRLTLQPDSIAHEILVDNNGKARGISYVERLSKKTHEVYGKVIVLSASTLESTRLMLLSKSRFHPNGIGNSSGLLGHYLMDHTYGAGANGYLTKLVGPVNQFDDSRANGIYVPRFRNLQTKRQDYIRGFGYQGGASRGAFPSHADRTSGYGAAFKRRVREEWPYPIRLYTWGEMLARKENHVRINYDKKDHWGIPVLHIECQWSDNELTMMKDAVDTAQEMLRAAGAEITEVNYTPRSPGTCIHEIGTARMGTDPKTSVLNAFNQSWDVKNLFVTDGASFPSSGCANPTLTMMAVTARACDYLLDKHKKGEV